ncbi:MAG: c-type cytochrome [Thiotrichales bacterium]|nr:c-type cytochrome [Thiotrichales bacterium]MCY4348971.1 c-type cytochrome [Thiotrichales bacterium]
MSKADDVFWRQFGVVLILLTVFGFGMYFAANSIAGQAYAEMHDDSDAVLARIAPMGQSRIGDPAGQTEAEAVAMTVATPPAASPAQTEESTDETMTAAASDASASDSGVQMVAAAGSALDLAAGEQVYQTACFACHATGVAEAPKLDDPVAWEPRLAQGMAGLLQSSINGKGAMPPKGGFAHLTEDDLRNAIAFMLDKAGVSAGG